MRWPSQLRCHLCMAVLPPLSSFVVQFDVGDILRPLFGYDFLEMSSSESVDCIFQFFCEGPRFAVVKECTCNTCIECSDFLL